MALTVELGTFLFFLIIPLVGLLFIKAVRGWGWPGALLGGAVGVLGFIMLGGMALYMFSDYDIVVSKDIPDQTSTEIQRNSTGSIVLNSTITTAGYTEVNPIIDDNQYIFGWIIFALAFVYGILLIKVIWAQ